MEATCLFSVEKECEKARNYELDKNALNFVRDIFSPTWTSSLDKPQCDSISLALASPWNIRQGHRTDHIASRRKIVAEAPQGAAAFECARASPDGGSTSLLTPRHCKVSWAALFSPRRRSREDFGSGAKGELAASQTVTLRAMDEFTLL
ncbi:hypothetical protein Q1695_010533 [Nippostrongylus brasiliensis]|nr:hypothetical protein Q1695_010533 [Nippostrongylus brasiliensis]